MDSAWKSLRRGEKIIDPHMPSGIEDEVRGDDEVEEVSGELVDKSMKQVEIPQKVTLVPRQQPPFPERLVKRPKMVNTGVLLLC